MWGAAIGAGIGLLGGLLNKSGDYQKQAYEAQQKAITRQEQNNENQYRYNLARNQASIAAGFSRSEEQMRNALKDYREQSSVIMGDNSGRDVARGMEAAMAQTAENGRNAAVLTAQANSNATDTYYQNKNNLEAQRGQSIANYYNAMAQQSAKASQGISALGTGLMQADFSSMLDGKKGLFETAFSKGK